MDRENDVQLIRSILSGNDEAFSVLVRKHQKAIHALAWRKVGDFHIAEEITQDTFLSVYKNLAQLKNPNQFAGWMYVIANRLCLKWLQKNRVVTQSLEDTPAEEIETSSYTHHISDQRQTAIAEDRQELVKRLLVKLPESERTVVTLFYLGEMTAKEIGKFLGVSVNTIKSRLRRGRQRLQEHQEELLVRETLGGIPFPAEVTERIMREVSNMKPIPAPVGKPLLPWAAIGTAAVLVILLLGASNQYLARFQKPYSFEAQSEPTIEIIDTPIIFNRTAKPAVRNQAGRAAAVGKSSGTGTQVSTTTTASVTLEDSAKFSNAKWTQGSAPPGGHVRDIFATAEGTVYAVAPTGIYRLKTDATAWTRVNTDIPIGKSLTPMAEHGGALYIVSTDEIFTSEDKGETWWTMGPRPKGNAVGLIIIDAGHERSSQARRTMYLALRHEGIYRSTDAGRQWTSFNDGLTSKEMSALAVVKKTVFAGTARGLYRLDAGIWKKLPVETSRAVYSLAVFENNLYVGTGPEALGFTPIEEEQEVPRNESHALKIFHSVDFGTSWTEITPSHTSSLHGVYDRVIPSGMKVLVTDEMLLVSTAMKGYRSTDNGQTWTELPGNSELFMTNSFPAVAVNETTFYKVGRFGIHRTTDGGKRWHLLIDGMVGTRLKDVVALNDRLYAHTGDAVYQSTDEGASWKKILMTEKFAGRVTTITNQSSKPESARVSHTFNSELAVDDNNLYLISSKTNNLQVSRVSINGTIHSSVQSIPTSDNEALLRKSRTGSAAAKEMHLSDGSEKEHHAIVPIVPPPIRGKDATTRIVVVCNDVFYAEHRRTLFKWRLGAPEWISTGLTDMSQQSYDNDSEDLKLAVSGETIYVGKRDGKLFQSFDDGNSWRDVTPSLPIHFTRFKEITFVNSTVYVATDEGVLSSETGAHWRVLTDNTGGHPIIARFAVDGPVIHGVGDSGVYRLDTRGRWKQVSSEVLGEAVSIATLNNKLYSAIEDRGIFHISLAGE